MDERRWQAEGAGELVPPERGGDPVLDRIVRLVASVAGTRHAAIHLLDESLQRRLAGVELELEDLPREDSFCRMVVDGGQPLVTLDAATDPRFSYSPFARGEDAIRFYAAAPLDLEGYGTIGTLCAWDLQPRDDAGRVLAELQEIAAIVVDALEANRIAALYEHPGSSDGVSGLANPRQLHERLRQALAGGGPLPAVVLIELGGLAQISQDHDYDAADDLVRAVADSLRAGALPGTFLSRSDDALLCAVLPPGIQPAEEAQRLGSVVATALAQLPRGAALQVVVGHAAARAGDRAEMLLRRARRVLFMEREARRDSPQQM